MGLLEISFIGIGLAMDAFAVSICKGLSIKKISPKKAIIIGLYFGLFQGIMPVIGFLLGTGFESFVRVVDHWIAFILLSFIGGNMIKDAFNNDECINDSVKVKEMSLLAIATSIDALAVGITFAFLRVNICVAAVVIAIITFILCIIGVFIGNQFGDKFEKRAKIFGGVILIIIGIKILTEHLICE